MRHAVWAARLAFSLVFVVNVACALQFVIAPALYAPGFQLVGVAGEAAVRGLGVAFLMWNTTYPLFVANPRKYVSMGAVVLVQQLIGCVGETGILLSLPVGYEVMMSSIMRFIAFDAAGLVIMGATYAALVRGMRTRDADVC